jgi:hypothetical protein
MTTTDPKDGSSRVEREILEILERAEASQTPVENIQAAVRRRRASVGAQVAHTRAPGWLQGRATPALIRLAAALGLAIAAALVSDVSHLLGVLLAIASAIAFFSLWVPSGPAQPGGKPRWRGQEIDDDRPPFEFALRRKPKPPKR